MPLPITGWAAVLAGAGLLVCAVRHLTKTAWHGFAIPLLAITCATSTYLAWHKLAVERPATAAAQAVTSQPDVRVVCRSWWNEFRDPGGPVRGFVIADGSGLSRTANLRHGVCADLRGWLRSPKEHPTLRQVEAVHILTHEAAHAGLGITDEAETECWAVQNNAATAVHLGATPAQARSLQDRYWTDTYPRLPSAYRSQHCAEDAEWDLTPGDGIWP